MLYTEDFIMRHHFGFLQIGSQFISDWNLGIYHLVYK